MLDVETYLLTKDNPGGPLLAVEPLPVEALPREPLTSGEIIGRILGLLVILALGVYSLFII